MELQQCRIFEAVARRLNITDAAIELGMSQPAVSQQLQKLEKECGTKLFLRHNYGIEVTREGRALLPAVESILTQVNRINMEFRTPTRRAGGHHPFIVGASNMFSATVLPEILIEFTRKYPSIDLVVETNSSTRIEGLVQSGKIEAALISNPRHLSGCEYESYMEHEAVAFVAPNNAIRKSLTLEELCKIPLVVRHGSSAIMKIRKQGYRPRFAAQFGGIEAVKTAVVGGMGVGILFRSRLEAELASGALCVVNVPELKAITLNSYVVFSASRAHSRNLKRFLEVLRSHRARASAGAGDKSRQSTFHAS